MDKSTDVGNHIVETMRAAREMQKLREQMTPEELEKADQILAKLNNGERR